MKTRNADFEESWLQTTLEETQAILRVTAHWMAIPLFSLFWLADIIYAPKLKWEFLAVRALIIPVCLVVSHVSKRISSFQAVQFLASTYAISLAFGINVMIYLLPDAGTPYYAGLNLIAIGALSFIPFDRTFYVITALGIYLPYFVIVALKAGDMTWQPVVVNSFFILSSVCMCFLIRFFHAATMVKETNAKLDLKNEILGREEIIRRKTEEAVRLNTLYSQFSPQIVDSIRSGKLKLESGGQRAQICAIFIDIVNSTERVTRIDKDKVEKVLSKFLDDTIKILLKYDITIDKFLGDGILAFCNAPLPRTDYISRVVNAALEVREKIEQEQPYYEPLWQSQLKIRVGIAMGFVNAGFYGSQKYFRSYTAIGPAVNLASRLCSSALPGQIVVDYDVHEKIKSEFETTFLGKKTLKGFDDDLIHAYLINSSRLSQSSIFATSDCPKCGNILSFENNDRGQFVLVCKSCSHTIEDNQSPREKAA